MRRRFVLPVAFSLTLHAVLLLGFNRPPPGPLHPAFPSIVASVPPKIAMTPEPPPPDGTDKASDSAAAAPRMSRPEPPVNTRSVNAFSQRPDLPPLPMPPGVVHQIPTWPAGYGAGTGGMGRLIDAGALDNPPHARTQERPAYPQRAKSSGVSGRVVVEFTVDESGRVHNARIVSSTDRQFEEATLRAVSRWLFEPGKKNSRAVPFRMAVPIVFDITE